MVVQFSLLGKGRGRGHSSYRASFCKALLFWERDGAVVMVIQDLFSKDLLFRWEMEGMVTVIRLSLLGKGRDVVVVVVQSLLLKSSPFLGKARGGGHGHIGPSSQELPSSAGQGKGWWSWSYSFLFWKREGAMAMVIQFSLLKKDRGNGHGHNLSLFLI